MKQSTRLIIFYSIIIVLFSLLGFFLQNRFKDFSIQDWINDNFMEEYNEINDIIYEGDFNYEEQHLSEDEGEDNENLYGTDINKWILSYDSNTNLNEPENEKNDGLRLTDEEIRNYYYYNCACPEGYSYTPEWVTYSEPGCEIEICKDENNCTLYSTSVSTTCNKKLDIKKISSRVPMARKDVENNYKRKCACPTGFDFVAKNANTYADSCDRKYCVDSDCKEIKTRHIRLNLISCEK